MDKVFRSNVLWRAWVAVRADDGAGHRQDPLAQVEEYGGVFEADFLPCSFGSRLGLSAHDAPQVLIDGCSRGRRWVAGTDIASCFSAVPHEKLMEAVMRSCGA